MAGWTSEKVKREEIEKKASVSIPLKLVITYICGCNKGCGTYYEINLQLLIISLTHITV